MCEKFTFDLVLPRRLLAGPGATGPDSCSWAALVLFALAVRQDMSKRGKQNKGRVGDKRSLPATYILGHINEEEPRTVSV